jgi:hypothetical protein
MIRKFCVPNADGDACLQCRCRIRSTKRPRRCAVFSGWNKQWPELFEFFQKEIERLKAEIEELKNRNRVAAVAAVRETFRSSITN